uniref:Transcription factor Adf-1 n=2 Tax=Timema TaxID=61471 RepID=A0A7R9DL31_TIMPO|nr:unnamed protein product [Timema poppensis]
MQVALTSPLYSLPPFPSFRDVVQVQRAHARVTGYVKRKWTEKPRHKMAEVPTQLRQIREDKTLIGLVKKYRLIYDPRHGDYKDVELKEEAWQNIADKLAKELHLTKTRWRNLRERFVREKKRLVTLGEEAYSAKDPWPLLEDMTFLWDFIVHRKRPSKTFKAKQVIMQSFLPILPRPEWVDVASDQGASSDNIEPSCTLNRGEETRLPIKRERDLVEEEATESKLRRLLDQPSSPNDTNSDITEQIVGADAIERFDRARPSTDEDDLFCLSVAATLRRFNSSKKALAKLKIQQIMYELECSDTSTPPKNGGNIPTETIFFS